jgi:hypothetical protein
MTQMTVKIKTVIVLIAKYLKKISNNIETTGFLG